MSSCHLCIHFVVTPYFYTKQLSSTAVHRLHKKVVFRLRGGVWLSKIITKLMITNQFRGETIPGQKTVKNLQSYHALNVIKSSIVSFQK